MVPRLFPLSSRVPEPTGFQNTKAWCVVYPSSETAGSDGNSIPTFLGTVLLFSIVVVSRWYRWTCLQGNVENRLEDTAWEGEGGKTEKVSWKHTHNRV